MSKDEKNVIWFWVIALAVTIFIPAYLSILAG